MQKDDSKGQARTAADSEQKDENLSVSQHNAKPLVVGSPLLPTDDNTSQWGNAVKWWQSKYPNTEPLKEIERSKDGYENAVRFMEMSGWSKAAIEKFKSDTIRSLSRFKEYRNVLYSLYFYQP
jgi:hypothetical protein